MPEAMTYDDYLRGWWGRCSHCERNVNNDTPGHRVTPISEGGRGVECVYRGDYDDD